MSCGIYEQHKRMYFSEERLRIGRTDRNNVVLEKMGREKEKGKEIGSQNEGRVRRVYPISSESEITQFLA